MTTFRSFGVLAALCIAGPAYTQSQAQQGPLRLVTASPGNIDSGMQVKSPSGHLLGTVASIIPGNSHNEGFVVIAGPEGTATPVPYGTASSMVRRDAIVLDKSRFAKAPKVQQYQTEDGSSTVWEQKANDYWKRNANTSGVRR
jgi:hypothetical protein